MSDTPLEPQPLQPRRYGSVELAATTPVLHLPYPASADPADVPTDMRELAEAIEAARGQPNGLASLDATGKVPAAQLPSIAGSVPLPIPIALQVPRTTTLAGNAFFTVAALATAGIDLARWELLKDVDGIIYGHVRCPEARAAATIVLALAAAATSGVTRMQAGFLIVQDGQSYDRALTDAAAQDVAVPATANARKDVTFAIGALAAGDHLLVRVFHAGAHANDTLAVNTLLLGAWLGGS
jgi:hypothetical protein